MMLDLLLIDIETVPQAENFNILSADWQQLWCDKISKTMPENITPEESYKMRGGILAEFGKIICISTGYFSKGENGEMQLRIKSIFGDDEVKLLNDFVMLCNKMYVHNKNFQFAGHNIKEFDIPYICRRMIVNRIPMPEYLQLHEKKPWEVKMLDTLNYWKFGDNKNYISLHLLANVLGIPTSKTDIDGSMVQDVYYKDKNLPRIVDYCQRDVIATANIILRFKEQNILTENHINIISG